MSLYDVFDEHGRRLTLDDLPAAAVQRGEAAQDRREGNARLQSGQRRAQAEVRAVAERHMLVLSAPDVECVRVGELVRVGGGSFSRMRNYVDLAFMGAAFLLLETKNIVQFALLFGTTWLVNSLVFAGVLLAVYLAIETASHVRLPRPAVLYAGTTGVIGYVDASPATSAQLHFATNTGPPLVIHFNGGGLAVSAADPAHELRKGVCFGHAHLRAGL